MELHFLPSCSASVFRFRVGRELDIDRVAEGENILGSDDSEFLKLARGSLLSCFKSWLFHYSPKSGKRKGEILSLFNCSDKRCEREVEVII